MFNILLIREIQHYLYSLRFQISLGITLLIFGVGTLSYVSVFGEIQNNYIKYSQYEQEILQEQSSNISEVATKMRSYVLAPRSNSLIADCKEQYIPNRYIYNAFNVYSFEVRHDSNNPLLLKSDNLNWLFMVTMFLSFITLLFAFDAVSGEKEERTLALVFSNKVPRGMYLLAKLTGIVVAIGCMELVGILVSFLVILLSGKVVIGGLFALEMLGFLLISLLFIVLFGVVGLFTSVVTRNSNTSLLLSLSFWLLSAVVIPNSSVFWAKKFFAIPGKHAIEQLKENACEDLEANGKPGRWSADWGNPFYYRHEIRAEHMMNLMLLKKQYDDAYYRQMFDQYEKTRIFTLLSPISQMEYLNEAFLGGGYFRFRKNWDDLHLFQDMFLQWFKDLDAADEKSPHWYNPMEEVSTSRLPVEYDQIPQYHEQPVPFNERLQYMSSFLAVMLLSIGVVFTLSMYLFNRYDVR